MREIAVPAMLGNLNLEWKNAKVFGNVTGVFTSILKREKMVMSGSNTTLQAKNTKYLFIFCAQTHD